MDIENKTYKDKCSACKDGKVLGKVARYGLYSDKFCLICLIENLKKKKI